MTAVSRAAAAPRLWIVSPRFDGWFFFASVAAVVLAWLASAGLGVAGFLILATVAVVSNGPHLASTWTRVYMDRREWRTRPIHIFVIPAAIAATVFGLKLQGFEGTRILLSVLLYWATWHFLSQNWGLLRIYQKRSGEPDRSLALRLEKPVLFLSVAWCLLHRLRTGPHALFGVEVYHLRPTLLTLNGLLAVVALLGGLLIGLRLREPDPERRRSAWLRLGFIACAFIGFYVPFVLMTSVDGTTAFAAAACWHGFQYIGIVRFYHRNAWRGGVHPDARIVSWVSQPGAGRLVLYGLLLLALAGAGYLVIFTGSYFTRGSSWTIETWGAATWLSLTFSHYWLDGVIWKLRRDRQVAARLLIEPAR